MRSEMQSEKLYALSEDDARRKIKEWYKDKKNLTISSVTPVMGHADSGYEVNYFYDLDDSEIISEKKKPYECSVCGKQGVKLWRPYGDSDPLICAACAEERQAPMEYDKHTWRKYGSKYIGELTEPRVKLPLPRWKVDENGKVPSYHGPGPKGEHPPETTQLIVNLKDINKAYSEGETTMMPAVPDENGNFWSYASVPEGRCEWWRQLPTR